MASRARYQLMLDFYGNPTGPFGRTLARYRALDTPRACMFVTYSFLMPDVAPALCPDPATSVVHCRPTPTAPVQPLECCTPHAQLMVDALASALAAGIEGI